MNDRYGSHLPVLTALSTILPMRRVLEFGAGLHSTPFFLGLPQCKRLVSVETDAKWRARVARKYASHKLTLRKAPPSRLEAFDLIFVDDGETSEDRAETIRWVLSRPHPPVVIHDAEVPEYREAIEELAAQHFTFDTDPQTELVR